MMAKWGEIKCREAASKCPRCEELKGKLNYAVGEWEDYEKIIKQLQAEWLANRVAILRLEAKLEKAVGHLLGAAEQLDGYVGYGYGDEFREAAAELTGGQKYE